MAATGAGSVAPPGPDEVWRRIADLDTKLQQVQSTANAALAASIAALTAGQAALTASQVSPAVGQGSGYAFTMTTSYATYASCTVPVPAGFTRAIVVAAGEMSMLTAASGDLAYARMLVNGNVGPESRTILSNPGWGVLPTFQNILLTGVSGSILIETQGRLTMGPGSNTGTSALATASVIFLV
jgi:hypothetical protein